MRTQPSPQLVQRVHTHTHTHTGRVAKLTKRSNENEIEELPPGVAHEACNTSVLFVSAADGAHKCSQMYTYLCVKKTSAGCMKKEQQHWVHTQTKNSGPPNLQAIGKGQIGVQSRTGPT